jgi:hypothetical protein
VEGMIRRPVVVAGIDPMRSGSGGVVEVLQAH